jgi:hypothetical protein
MLQIFFQLKRMIWKLAAGIFDNNPTQQRFGKHAWNYTGRHGLIEAELIG